jgi:tRNA A-37 threonylcarbamoyl transferase component Bud32
VVVIAKHQSVLARVGLTTLEQFKQFEAETIERVAGRRDVLRLRTTDEAGRELVLFLKRHWRSHKKDGLASLLRRGRVGSVARSEWENAQALQSAGLKTAALVAYAEERGLLWEKFSCLLTEAASGSQTVGQFLRECRDRAARRRIFDALAREVLRMHEAGLSMPDLFTRHIFFDPAAPTPEFCFIDMARLERGQPVSWRSRVRALAALHVSAPLRSVTWRERLRFLRRYAGRVDRRLVLSIEARTQSLLQRKKYRDFLAPVEGAAGRVDPGK